MPILQDVLDLLVAGEVRFPPNVQDQLRLRANHLRMLPAIAMQALEVAKDPDCGIDEFAGVVERDEMLATETLKMANSIMFGGSRTVMNLHQAVVRIGFRQCKSLIIASGFSSMMKKMTLQEEWIREVLWRHGFTTGLISLHLNRSLNVGFQGEEFTGGLMHDIGRMLLATCFPGQFTAVDSMGSEESSQTLVCEQNAFETNHCEVGMWFTQKNSLPEPLVDVVRFHHCPEQSQHNRRFVALIAACDHMANHLQRCEQAVGYDPRSNTAVELLEECGVHHATSRFAEIAATVMEAAHRDALDLLAL